MSEQTTEQSKETSNNSSTETPAAKPTENSTTQPPATSQDSKAETSAEGKKPEEAAKPVEEAKPSTESKPSEEEGYDIEVKEGSLLTQADLDEIAETASELGLNKEQAQKLVESREKVLQNGLKLGEDKWSNKFQAQLKEFNEAPDFAGEKRAIADKHMARAITSFGDENLVAYLNTPEGGSNVHLARFLVRIGEALAPAESTTDLVNKNGVTPGPSEPSQLERMYPSMFPKK